MEKLYIVYNVPNIQQNYTLLYIATEVFDFELTFRSLCNF